MTIDLGRMKGESRFRIISQTFHFGSYKPGKQWGTLHKGRNSVVKSSQLSWGEQYKKCVQYDFKFTSDYSGGHDNLVQMVDVGSLSMSTWIS